MPGTNLTRDEAQTRARLLAVESYTIDLDLTTSETTFGSTTTIRFTCSEPGADTFADLVGATVHEITLNGTSVDPATAYADSRIALSGLAADNELVVRADCTYSRSGEGLHRFVDPADDRVYLYTQFEVPGRPPRVHHVRAARPQVDVHLQRDRARRTGRSSPTRRRPSRARLGDGRSPCGTSRPTKRMSTYITALVAGEYHEVRDTYEGKRGEIPLGHYCRQSLVEHLDVDELVKLTKQGFEYFEDAFDLPYPFGKYDQLFVPEYNMGAMENAGCVTFRDEYLPRSRQDRAFYEVRAKMILHEMAHMWFGDLVTMKWWDDLWLNESFAEWACTTPPSRPPSTTRPGPASPTPARPGPTARTSCPPPTRSPRTTTTSRPSRSTSTASPTPRARASLKQLVAWVGQEHVPRRPRRVLQATTPTATPSSPTCSRRSRRPRAASSSAGRRSGCRPPASTPCAPSFELDDDGTLHVVRGRADRAPGLPDAAPAPPRHRPLRRRRRPPGAPLERRDRRRRRETEVPELVGEQQPDLVLLNDGDLDLRQDPPRRALAGHRGRRPRHVSTTRWPGPCAGARRGT